MSCSGFARFELESQFDDQKDYNNYYNHEVLLIFQSDLIIAQKNMYFFHLY